MNADAPRPAAPLGVFARYLTLWVALCIVGGMALGYLAPGAFAALSSWDMQHINLPVAALVWVMIVPMLLRVDLRQLAHVRAQWRGVGITLLVNWAVKPFSMALLGWLFVRHAFASWLPAGDHDAYIAGLVLLAAAPCTAMVFVWSRLCGGDPHFTLAQVALNDAIMVVAFGPIVGLLLGVASIHVPWGTLLLCVCAYIAWPVVLAQAWRAWLLRRGGEAALHMALQRLEPCSTAALLATLVLLFGFQGETITRQPLVIALLAVPIVIQVYVNAGLAYGLSRWFKVPHCVAGPSALIGASNFFELAVAAAISLFGLRSGAALATVVGVLVEVPVMLSVVWLVNRSAPRFDVPLRAPALDTRPAD